MPAKTYEDYIVRWDDPLQEYRFSVGKKGVSILSDGCSGVSEAYHIICVEHDIHYATHKDFYTDRLISQEDADKYLMWGIQFHSWFGRLSPMARWRYRALSSKKGLSLGKEPWETGPERLLKRLAEEIDTKLSAIEEDLGA